MIKLPPPPREKSSPLAMGQWLEEAWRKINALITGSTSVSTVTSATTLTAEDDVILANPTSAGFTITFPTVGTNPGKVWTIKNIGTNFNIVTLSGPATTLNTAGETVKIYDDGAAYRVLDRYIPSVWVAYTPTIAGLGSGSATTDSYWRRVGDSLDISVSISKTGGAGSGASVFTFTVPSGLAMDPAKIGNAAQVGRSVGRVMTFDIEAAAYHETGASYQSTTTIGFFNLGSGSQYTGSTLGTNAGLAGIVTVPISGWAS